MPAPRPLETLSPFELKNRLLAWAASGTGPVLDAGRGNPDWLALPAREAFFVLGAFACEAARATDPRVGMAPEAEGLQARLRAWAGHRVERDGLELLFAGLDYAGRELGVTPDRLLHALIVGVLGIRYPDPPAMLPEIEQICRAHLARVCGLRAEVAGSLRLFATEGASAGVCYVLRTLVRNGLLAPGERVAVVVPVFTPYLELLQPEAFGFELVALQADAAAGWQLPDAEVDKLLDPRVRLLIVVNPGNPTSVALRPETVDRITHLVATRRPDLLVLTDDVYAPLAPGYASLLSRAPRNTILVYSFSKYFGATGWRLGLLAMADDHAADAMLAARGPAQQAGCARRYAAMSEAPDALPLLARTVADSREIAFHHTAGLSTPQQVQMALFALGELLDAAGAYRDRVARLLAGRREALWRGLGEPLPRVEWGVDYYETLDVAALAARWFGEGAAERLVAQRAPLDTVVELARGHGVVVLPGRGFGAPPWTVRVSLANLPDAACEAIGREIRRVVQHLCGAA